MSLEKWELQILIDFRIYAYTINIYYYIKCVSKYCQDMPNLRQTFIFCLCTDDNGVAISNDNEWKILPIADVYSSYLFKNLHLSK